jgi:release factor glutamine methyltransferase
MEANPDRVRNRRSALLAGATVILEAAGVDSPSLDAELLLGAAAGVDRSKLFSGSYSLDEHSIARFDKFVERRAAREPLAYIVGHKEFYGLEFEVNAHVLIPRPETELLVETALEFLARKPQAMVLDLGTGSGAIAIAIAVNAPGVQITATDISTAALTLARHNAERLGCAERVEFAAGDCWAALPCSHPKFDLILSNPPYIPADELARLQPEVARFEPEIALSGGRDGLKFYRRIAREVTSYLTAGGEVIVEVGARQAGEVAGLLSDSGCRVLELPRDLAGHERVVRARLAR